MTWFYDFLVSDIQYSYFISPPNGPPIFQKISEYKK